LTDVESFLAILSGLVIAYRRPSVSGPAVAQHLLHLMPTALPVLKKLKANQKLYVAAIKVVGAKKAPGRTGMPSLSFGNSLLAIRKDLKAHGSDLKKFLYSPDVHESQQKLIGLLQTMLTPDSATIEKKDVTLDKKISIVPDKLIRTWMVPQQFNHEQPQHINEAKHLMRKMTGQDSLVMSVDKRKELKENHPKQYQRLSDAMKQADQVWKTFVRTYVRTEGKHVRIADLAREMHNEKIVHQPFDQLVKARLGDLRIDEDGKLYTPDDAQLNCGIPPIGSKITLNKNYSKDPNAWMFRFQVPGSKARGTAAYRVGTNLARKDATVQKILKAIPKMPDVRKKWLRDLMGSDPYKRTLGAMAETAWETAMRIGSPGNKKDNVETHGLSTLQVGHVNINGDTLIMTYFGKDAIPQRQILKGKSPEHLRVIAVVKRLMQGKSKKDYLWTDPQGRRITETNPYLRSVGLPAGLSVHKFRHIRGTSLMQNLLEKARVPKNATQPQVEKIVKTIAVNVGHLLGHKSGKVDKETGEKTYTDKASMAIGSYIVPKVIADFFQDRNLRVPNWVPKAGRGNGEKFELAPTSGKVSRGQSDRPIKDVRKAGPGRLFRETEVRRRGRQEEDFDETPPSRREPVRRTPPSPTRRPDHQPKTPGNRLTPIKRKIDLDF
jgi:DNA topoisomerase IB